MAEATKSEEHEERAEEHSEAESEADAKDDSKVQAKEAEDKKKDKKDEEVPDILPKGNPLRMKRGILEILLGGIPAFLLMAKNTQGTWCVPVGFLCLAVASFGVLDLLGSFDDAESTVKERTTIQALYVPLAKVAAMLVVFGFTLYAGQAAIGPKWLAPIAVTGAFLGLVAVAFQLGQALGPWKLDELGEERSLLHRHGFWVMAIGALLYFPAMGIQSLWDPWETHYGEVAREILARDDWVSLWWAQDGWFWSKPILNFWIQSLAMATLGTHYTSDAMLIAANGTPAAHPEWVVRAPNVLMTLGAMYLLYKGVAKVFGRRAGLIGAVVLATMPDWFFLAHQTMTDMPFVAAMTAAMGLLLLGLNTPEEEMAKTYEVTAFGRTIRLSLFHVVFGVTLLCALPQIIYLLTRNLELVIAGDGPHGFRVHWDEFKSGSAGNCGLPGNEACTMHAPASIPKSVGANPDGMWPSVIRYFGGIEPSLQAVVWSAILGTLFYVNWGERRVRRLLYIGAWLAAAVATMAKGPAGFGLPMICAFAYVATKKRWSEILRFELLSGILVILAVALPWYVAMYVRHGSPFTDRLIFHDMFNRAFSHVHDTNEGDDTGIRYYIWQLGYALFPWTGLAPLGLIWSFRNSDSALARVIGLGPARQEGTPYRDGADTNPDAAGGVKAPVAAVGDASVMLVMWFLFAFALFTFMGTKFHHYIFPAVPPVAMLIGVVIDDVVGRKPLVKHGSLALYFGGLTAGAAIATWGVSRWWTGSFLGTVKAEAEHDPFWGEPSHVLAVVAGILGLALVFFAARTFGMREERDGVEPRRATHQRLMLGGAAVLSAMLIVLVARDLAIKPEGADQPGAIRLLHLFTYNYKRPWPDSLDFNAILAGFGVVGAALLLAAGASSMRRHAFAAFGAFAVVWALWGLDVYMVQTSPHWGQHEVMEAYYRDRKGPEEQLVAYQMNWKGENFYTGNHIPAFVSTGATFQTWLKGQKEKGVKVMYFVTEHSRTGGLRSEVAAKAYKDITDKTLDNKFILVRAEL